MNERTAGKPIKLFYFHELRLYSPFERLWTVKSMKWGIPQSNILFLFFLRCCLSLLFLCSLSQRSSFTTIMCKWNRLCWIHRHKTWKPWQRQWPMTEIRLHRLHLNCRKIREGFFSVLHCNNFSSIYIFYIAKPYSWLWLGLSILTQTTTLKWRMNSKGLT